MRTLSRSSLMLRAGAALLALVVGACTASPATRDGAMIPGPTNDPAPATRGHEQVAVFAGGCFWGLQAVFEHVKGVQQVWAGYAGGSADTASYYRVSDGDTGHAESVKIVYDPAQVSYGTLLKVFFSVAHDPTQLDRQGPDHGTQYRSEIFTTSAQQAEVARAYIAQLEAARVYPAPIVTKVEPLPAFYMAEGYHQDYYRTHPNDPYIVYNDAPKVAALRKLMPALYQTETALAQAQQR
ncbi:peptide-methionine (S)-S-oxide reductase MsrA [Dyella sp.]|jgi:peptide-methionine (S)-S-oxide reductase|uniref:peptide-methionine (S)-S-oxide reductase MsrA n=1 Tax=Dyella sp. TaxID=1869338 RepID=UPI002D779018|nr:peptide-methionine (S)-S-oxide reductase MsrA [Dyella sp.]HET6432501.1 peptide-methionine (S)-S-oxide reductase MsrA [Dyella sp.]